MQVNRVQQSPNFGMGAYFTKLGAKAVSANPSKALNEKISRVAEAVKDTKTYHIEITSTDGENVLPRVVSPYANKYLPPYQVCRTNGMDHFTVYAKWDGTNLGGDCVPGNAKYPITLGYNSPEEAAEGFTRAKKSDFDAAAEIAKKLDEVHSKKTAAELAKQQQKDQNAADAVKLIESLGIKEPEGAKYIV